MGGIDVGPADGRLPVEETPAVEARGVGDPIDRLDRGIDRALKRRRLARVAQCTEAGVPRRNP